MFNIDFYETSDGYSDIQEFLESLRNRAKTVKDAQIQYSQIARCIELLQKNGTNLPTQIAKHLDDGIWELRPSDNRVLFFFDRGTYVLLHHFRKKTQKTPPREITRAKSEKIDYIARKEATQ